MHPHRGLTPSPSDDLIPLGRRAGGPRSPGQVGRPRRPRTHRVA
jgi:hypothetical protein